MSHAIVWDVQDKLSFALPFQDMKPTMFLGVCVCVCVRACVCARVTMYQFMSQTTTFYA